MRHLAIAVLLSSCGSSARSQPDAPLTPDAVPGGPNVVMLKMWGTPTFIQYRDGAGEWIDPGPPDAMGRYTLHVTDTYEVVAVCTRGAAEFDAEQLNATVADGDEVTGCGVGVGPDPMTVAVTGTMNQAGDVWMWDSASSATAPWNFSLAVPPGLHDLFALGGGKLVARRGVQIAGPTTVPTIDLDSEGLATGAATVTLAGLQTGDVVGTYLDWFTSTDFAELSGSTDGTVVLPPASLVQPSDVVELDVFAESSNPSPYVGRHVSVSGFDGSTTMYTLPEVLTGISYTTSNNALTAAWTSLPTYVAIDVGISSWGSLIQLQDVRATRNWVMATGATSLTFDASAPQYSAAWRVALTKTYGRVFDVVDVEGAVESDTQLDENVTP